MNGIIKDYTDISRQLFEIEHFRNKCVMVNSCWFLCLQLYLIQFTIYNMLLDRMQHRKRKHPIYTIK